MYIPVRYKSAQLPSFRNCVRVREYSLRRIRNRNFYTRNEYILFPYRSEQIRLSYNCVPLPLCNRLGKNIRMIGSKSTNMFTENTEPYASTIFVINVSRHILNFAPSSSGRVDIDAGIIMYIKIIS